jgi:hypothetical protein
VTNEQRLIVIFFWMIMIVRGIEIWLVDSMQVREDRFTNFTKLLINNPAYFLLAPLSGVLPLACPLTYSRILQKTTDTGNEILIKS